MNRPGLLWIVALAACGTAASSPKLDGGIVVDVDAPDSTDDAAEPDDDGPAAYSHTITIDGGDDFVGVEAFATTSAAYGARVTWDAQNVYVGYSGPDLDPAALDTGTKWLFVYVDFDPGAGSGAVTSETYNTQQAAFPSGFGAELYARWKCDATFSSIEQHQGGSAYTTIATPTAAQSGEFVELAIPRVLLGGSGTIGLVAWMINEKPNFEGSFAGLFASNFPDGYSTGLPLTKYLRVDFTSDRVPNDPLNEAP